MKCSACQSDNLQLIKVFGGHNPMGWSPVGGEKDIFGSYKKLSPLLAHACSGCGTVTWNIRVQQEQDPNEAAQALDALASEEIDPNEDSVAYTLGEDLI